MDFDRKSILGLLLIGLIIVVTSTDFYQKWLYNGEIPQPPTESVPATGEVGIEQPQQPSTAKPAVSEAQPAASIVAPGEAAISEQSKVSITTPLFVAELSNMGPAITSWHLLHYPGPDSLPVQLINKPVKNLSLSIPAGRDTLDLSHTLFNLVKGDPEAHLSESNPSASYTFALELEGGQSIEQQFTFYYDRYDFDMLVALRGFEEALNGISYSLNFMGGMKSTEKQLYEDMDYAGAWALGPDGETQALEIGHEAIVQVDDKRDWNFSWTAVRNKYFTAVIIPQDKTSNGAKFFAEGIQTNPDEYYKHFGVEMYMPYNAQTRSGDLYKVYLGPLKYDLVRGYNVQLEKMMNFGWAPIRPISKGVLWVLQQLYKVIPNYGFVIIVFSILIKIIVFPLTKKSYQSMKGMSKLQPLMKELQEKHKDSPQKLNQEMMKLYQEHGVNPLSGCLPMLLQMPLLYSLFIVFRSTIELRGAPFIGWITDLSAPDTVFTLPFALPFYGDGVNVLPIIMGLTMFVQQKMTVQNPNQKAMIYIMPGLFAFIFNNFPSGLTMYYTLFNVLSVIQQRFVPDSPEKPKPAVSKNGKMAKKPRRPKSRMDFYRHNAKSRKK